MTKKEELELLKEEIRKDIEADVRKEVEAKVRAEAELKADSIPDNSERELAKIEKSMKEQLLAQEKVMIFVPEDATGETQVVTVTVNGVQFAIPRGKEFLVPKAIKEVWDRSYAETIRVNRRIKVQDVENNQGIEIN